jgi:hypothetical protein
VNEEFLLTVMYMAAGIGVVVCVLFLAWFLRAAETVRSQPFRFVCACSALVGLLTLVATIASTGDSSFDIPGPWGKISSSWVDIPLILLGLVGIYVFEIRKPRKLGDRRRGSVLTRS